MFESSDRRRARVAVVAFLALGLALAAGAASSAEQHPDLSGTWHLDAQASDDIQAKVEAVVGPDRTTGGGSDKSKFTILPRGGGSHEIDRVQLRRYLLEQVAGFEDLEIEQNAREIILARGNDTLRIFSFDRERSRDTSFGMRTVARVRWNGPKLVLEETGEDTQLVETFTLVPDGTRLTHAIHFESKSLLAPLDLRLLYTRVTE